MFKLKTESYFKLRSFKTIVFAVIILCLVFIRNVESNKLTELVDGWNSSAILSADSNYYSTWINPPKLINISGTYEYITRDFYFTFLKKENIAEAKDNVESYIEKHKKSEENKYTGLFKGKNLIYVLMESEDDWMINEKVTPTIYEMMQHGFNFNNHYSAGYVTGDTISTEFLANAGIYPRINNLTPNYAYVNNSYPFSIANVFKGDGYTVNSFHVSGGGIYNRLAMHKALGYEKYNNYSDMGIPDEYMFLDSYIIKNSYDKIVSSDKFMSFIISYSAHDPYSYEKIECSANIDDIKKIYPDETNEEVLCSYSASRELDNMFKLLIENLEKDNLLDNTVIVAFSDHRNKDVSLNGEDDKLNKTAFFIYDSTMDSHQIDTITSGINILPTVINLFGMGTDFIYPEYDALSTDKGYVVFRDYTYYDGNDMKQLSQDMVDAIDYSAGILTLDYYKNNE